MKKHGETQKDTDASYFTEQQTTPQLTESRAGTSVASAARFLTLCHYPGTTGSAGEGSNPRQISDSTFNSPWLPSDPATKFP